MGRSLRYFPLLPAAITVLVAGCSGASDGDLNLPDASPDAPAAPADGPTDAPMDLPNIRINEVAAGEAPDWVEFVNLGDVAIELAGLRILDANDATTAVPLAASGTLEPGTYLAVDIANETVGFKLGGDEEFWLYTAAGDVIDSVDWNEGDAATGKSYARQPDGTGDFVSLETQTKGAANP
ncbi:MAG: lamin tail domain-containing protein [Myxococcales bacterium]|nr:lamin tail domain-containing protein [Myxococcales bacterium]